MVGAWEGALVFLRVLRVVFWQLHADGKRCWWRRRFSNRPQRLAAVVVFQLLLNVFVVLRWSFGFGSCQ